MSTAPSARPPRSGSPERRARGVTPASVPAARRNSLRGATRAATMSRGDELAVPALWHAPGRDCSLLGLRPFLHLLLDLPQLQALGGAGSRLLRAGPGAGAPHPRPGTRRSAGGSAQDGADPPLELVLALEADPPAGLPAIAEQDQGRDRKDTVALGAPGALARGPRRGG